MIVFESNTSGQPLPAIASHYVRALLQLRRSAHIVAPLKFERSVSETDPCPIEVQANVGCGSNNLEQGNEDPQGRIHRSTIPMYQS